MFASSTGADPLGYAGNWWSQVARTPTLPPLLPQRAAISVGVGPRWPGRGDQTDTVMEHAAVALRLADMACQRAGDEAAGAWRVWQPG